MQNMMNEYHWVFSTIANIASSWILTAMSYCINHFIIKSFPSKYINHVTAVDEINGGQIQSLNVCKFTMQIF